MTRTSRSGFTLLELLIVIGIIAVLAAILVPNLLSARVRALDSLAVGCARQIATAEAIYRIDNDTFASNLASLDPGVVEQCDAAWVISGGDPASYSYTVKHDANPATRTFTVTPAGIN